MNTRYGRYGAAYNMVGLRCYQTLIKQSFRITDSKPKLITLTLLLTQELISKEWALLLVDVHQSR
jgi:hypothetical protein